jgi:hypothetical protein
MRRSLLITGVLLVVLACGRRGDQADVQPGYTYDIVDYPGATMTIVTGIGSAGELVGWYAAGDKRLGFVYHNGEYATVEYPGAAITQLTGIGEDGTLSGSYREAGAPGMAWQGFIRRPNGEFVAFRHPDHPNSMAQRVLANGTIIGCYHGMDFTTTMRAISMTNGSFTVRDIPGGMHNGGTPDGRRLVGNLAIERRGFVAEGDQVTYLDAPGSKATEAWDINQAGAIVGVLVDSADVAQAYVYENGRFTALDVPNARSSVAFGIDARGQIVGGFEDSDGIRRGFIARR